MNRGSCGELARAGFAQPGEPVQEAKRLFQRINEIIRCDERAFADVLIDSDIGTGLRLVAKIDPHPFSRR